MKQFEHQQDIKSTIVTTEALERICNYLLKISNNDTQTHHATFLPEFKISTKEGMVFKFSKKEEFIQELDDQLLKVRGIPLSYSGKDMEISVHYRKSAPDYLSLEIGSSDKGDLLVHIGEFKNILKRTGWNWIVHNQFFIFVLFSIFTASTTFVAINLFPSVFVHEDRTHALLIGVVVSTIAIVLLPRIYPKLVIVAKNQRVGREFKKDIWKLIVFLIAYILIPILTK